MKSNRQSQVHLLSRTNQLGKIALKHSMKKDNNLYCKNKGDCITKFFLRSLKCFQT